MDKMWKEGVAEVAENAGIDLSSVVGDLYMIAAGAGA